MSSAQLLAAFLAAAAPNAESIPDDHQFKWDGALQIVSQSTACQGLFSFRDNDRVRYHPQVDEFRPFSALTRFRGNEETELFIVNAGQLDGRGDYVALKISGGLIFGAQSKFDFTQTPKQVTPETQFVSLLGSFEDYGGISGCRVTIRASMSRVDPEMDLRPPSRR